MLRCLTNSINDWFQRAAFEQQAFDAKIKGVLTNCVFAMIFYYIMKMTTTSLTIINHLCLANELYWKVVEPVDSHLKLTETINTVNQRETGENRPILLMRTCCGYG